MPASHTKPYMPTSHIYESPKLSKLSAEEEQDFYSSKQARGPEAEEELEKAIWKIFKGCVNVPEVHFQRKIPGQLSL